MARLNLTLDADTFRELDRYTRQLGKPRARVAKELLREGLERRRKLAADYVADRSDAGALLKDLEAAQLGLPDDDEA